MDFNNSSDSEKSKTEPNRIPSPASVSSVHSIRPLEWDSGADIGYEFKHQFALSTVESIALKSGTVNLLESCISQDTSTNRSYVSRYVGNPLAQSSPCTRSIELPNVNASDNPFKPLVDYSISQYSFDEKIEEFESQTPPKVEVLDKSDRASKLRSDESSKSLDDLRNFGRTRSSKTTASARSRSSQNLLIPVNKNLSEKNSSSSLATLVPSIDEFRARKYSNKSVQVDDVRKTAAREKNGTFSKASLEFFKKICNEDANDNDPRNALSKRGSNSEADGESVDGGSFEYVPGSKYVSLTSDTGSKGASSVNTLCSEVTDGVALLTKYVNELNVSNKRQIIEKVAKSLINNLSDLSGFKNSSRESRSNLLLSSSPDLNARTPSYCRSSERNSVESHSRLPNMKSNSKSSSSHYIDSRSSTNNSSRFEACISSKESSRLPTGLDSFRSSRSYSVGATSSCKVDSNSGLKSSGSNETASPQPYSLKEYLKKERDAQLLWIKSNISHLKNLRKLCENEKLLQSELNTLKKSAVALRPTTEILKTGVSETLSPRKKHTKSITRNRPTCTPHKISSELTSNSRTSCDSNGVLSTSESVNKTMSTRTYDCFNEKKQLEAVTDEDICRCSCKKCCRKSNKENVLANAKAMTRCEKSVSCRRSKCVAPSKQPISYTIIFDADPNFDAGKNFEMKEYVKRRSVRKVTNRAKKITKTKSITELRSTSNDRISDQTVTLQEYLIHNKPEYVNRAEYRRQCLAEIAKLRELRDKSREELVSAVQNMNIVKSVAVPLPLSVVRLFDDKTMKKETEKKYQQLPEVQNKKLELKRKDTYRRNHIMAKIFTKRLQKKVLKGQVNLANNVNVLSI